MGLELTAQFVGDRVWTVDNLDEAIGEDEAWRRYEIVDGVLIVSPHAVPRHELTAKRLMIAIDPHVPQGFEALGSLGIVLDRSYRSYRVTDVTVVDRRVFDRDSGSVVPGEVLLAIEIESPSSITTDRITKPAQYAAAGIAHFWRVEMDPLRLHTYRLAGTVYEQTGEWGADEVAHIEQPFTVEIELSSLLP